MSVFEYDIGDREQHAAQAAEVLGGYDPAQYASERYWVDGRRRVQVPVSLV